MHRFYQWSVQVMRVEWVDPNRNARLGRFELQLCAEFAKCYTPASNHKRCWSKALEGPISAMFLKNSEQNELKKKEHAWSRWNGTNGQSMHSAFWQQHLREQALRLMARDFPLPVASIFYEYYVRPVLEYASPVWPGSLREEDATSL